MKILLVIASMGIGGEQRAASTITDYLVKMGNFVSVLTFDASNEKQIDFNSNIEKIIIDKSKRNIYRLTSIRMVIKSSKPDIVIGFAVIPSILCSLSSIGLNVPVVVCERNDPEIYSYLWKAIRSFAYKFAVGAVFQTNDASLCFSNKYFKSRIVIPNPIRSDIKNYRKPIETRNKVIVNTSRLTKAKNQNLIINAFAKLHDRYNDYHLELYGDGDCRDDLQQLINDKGLESCVTIHKATTNIFAEIANDKIFILASSHEGFPNSLAEAMALGLSVISVDCRIGGPKDMIEDGVNGRLIPVNDQDAFVKALEDLLSNEDNCKKMGRQAMKIADRLSVDNIGQRWESYLRKVIDSYEK